MDYVEIYDGNWEKIIKNFTIFKGPHYFYKNLIYKTIVYITNILLTFLKLQNH